MSKLCFPVLLSSLSPTPSSAWWACTWPRAMWQVLWPFSVISWWQHFLLPLPSHPLLTVNSVAAAYLCCVVCSSTPSFTTFHSGSPAHVSESNTQTHSIILNKMDFSFELIMVHSKIVSGLLVPWHCESRVWSCSASCETVVSCASGVTAPSSLFMSVGVKRKVLWSGEILPLNNLSCRK